MSVKLMGEVWDSDLPRDEKMVALAYADHASHDGEGVYPSVGLISWKTGYGTRQVQRIKKKLLDRGVLKETGRYRSFGQTRLPEYEMVVQCLPKRVTWSKHRLSLVGGDTGDTSEEPMPGGDTGDTSGCFGGDTEDVSGVTRKTPKPSGEPSEKNKPSGSEPGSGEPGPSVLEEFFGPKEDNGNEHPNPSTGSYIGDIARKPANLGDGRHGRMLEAWFAAKDISAKDVPAETTERWGNKLVGISRSGGLRLDDDRAVEVLKGLLDDEKNAWMVENVYKNPFVRRLKEDYIALALQGRGEDGRSVELGSGKLSGSAVV